MPATKLYGVWNVNRGVWYAPMGRIFTTRIKAEAEAQRQVIKKTIDPKGTYDVRFIGAQSKVGPSETK